MDMVNIFSAENAEGRVDVACAVGSSTTSMFIYDLAPGQRQSPYHYEYEEEWLLVVERTLVHTNHPPNPRTLRVAREQAPAVEHLARGRGWGAAGSQAVTRR